MKKIWFIAFVNILLGVVSCGENNPIDESAVEYWQVSWNLNGGAWTAGYNPAAQVVKGGTLAEPNAPTKSGSTFDGWYKESGLTNKVSFPYDVSAVTGNFTLYAKWTAEGGGTTNPDGTFTSIAALKTWLENRPANTATTPYKIVLKGVNLDTNNGWGNLGLAVIGTKFVDLDLSGCTGATIPDGSTKITGTTITTSGVFYMCYNLTTIKLTPNLVTIGVNAFRACHELISVVLPETLKSINEDAFHECYKLESFVVPKGVTSIGGYAFGDCRNLASIILSAELQSIGSSAFNGCEKLSSVIIPGKVTSMGSDIFWNCYDLTEIIMKPITPPSLDGYSGKSLGFLATKSVTIKVPAASLNAYKTTTWWKDYASNMVANTD